MLNRHGAMRGTSESARQELTARAALQLEQCMVLGREFLFLRARQAGMGNVTVPGPQNGGMRCWQTTTTQAIRHTAEMGRCRGAHRNLGVEREVCGRTPHSRGKEWHAGSVTRCCTVMSNPGIETCRANGGAGGRVVGSRCVIRDQVALTARERRDSDMQ